MDAVSPELVGVVGFHNVTKEQARELIQAFISTDGFYLLRPSNDPDGSVLCTICVTNKHKLVNYRLRLVSDRASRSYYIYTHTTFSGIQQLLEHYRRSPINADANTRLLYPVTPASEKQSLEGEDCYVIMERTVANADPPQPQLPTVNSPSASLPPKEPKYVANPVQNGVDPSHSADSDIPGLHRYLPRQEISTVMQAYLSTNGCYLIRHSTTSAGQFTMAVSHGGKVLNFKINCQDGQYFISPRRRFNSVQELLLAYRTSPMKSKRCGNEKIFLSNPIPVDQILEKKFQQMMENKALAQAEPLPEPWKEYFNEEYRRPYFYNTITGASVWERPKLSEPQSQRASTLPDKAAIQSSKMSNKPRIQSRPLPAPPVDNAVTTQSQVPSRRRFSDQVGSISPSLGRRPQLPLPHLLTTEENTPPQLPPTDRRVPVSKRALPPLPPKDDEVDVLTRSLPPLPSSKDSSQSMRRDARPQLPQRSTSVQEPKGRPIPPLPPKEPDGGATTSTIRGKQPLPQLPPKDRELPPLPPKDDRPLPPLPPKVPGQHEATPSPGPGPGSGQRERKRRAVVEYEDNVLLKEKEEGRGVPTATKDPVAGPQTHLRGKAALPPLPEINPTPVSPPPPVGKNIPAPPPPPIGQSIPPPPPPPVGKYIPAPPPPPVGATLAPPPPKLPPPRSPTPSRGNLGRPPPTNESSSEGRPFSANDLLAAKTLLKKTLTPENSPDLRRHTVGAGGGLADVFASAIDTRMTSIRKAMVDSDSDESEFEDVDDEEDWD